VELELGSGNNLIYGPNASGKTSILEAAAYLGRGRSFRGASTRELIRHEAEEFVLFGRADTGPRQVTLGVRNSRAGLEVHTDGEKKDSAAPLAEALPLQIIDPDVHKLIAGGPEERRRYADWIAFHVEHGYLERWRRFRRALKQRNAALRAGAQQGMLTGWDQELAELGVAIDDVRRRMLEITRPALTSTISEAGEPTSRWPRRWRAPPKETGNWAARSWARIGQISACATMSARPKSWFPAGRKNSSPRH
jgi:DNA replication and repair protein RecF